LCLGAETAIYLALAPADFQGARGVLWAEKRVVNFEKGSMVREQIPMLKKYIAEKFKSKKKD
jgi:hypothetical protein